MKPFTLGYNIIVHYAVLINETEKCLLFPEWSGARKTLDLSEELTHNGRSEPQQPEDIPVIPAAAPLPQVNTSCCMLTSIIVWSVACLDIMVIIVVRLCSLAPDLTPPVSI